MEKLIMNEFNLDQKEQLSEEREYYTNKSNCRVMIAVIACIVLFFSLTFCGIIRYVYHPLGYFLTGISVIILITGLLICRTGKYSKPYHKYIIIYFMSFAAAIIYAGMGVDVVAIFVIPLLLSGRYGSGKLCWITYFVSLILNGSAGLLAAYLDLHLFHSLSWLKSISDALMGMVLPLVLTTTVMAVVVFGMVQSDKKGIIQILKARELAAKREAEFQTGAELQMNSLPKDFNVSPGGEFSLYARIIPSKETSGDFYDFFTAGDGRAVFVIGDVSDKGIPAALYMMSARNTIRALCKVMNDPAKIMTEANRIFLETSDEAFVTMFIAFVDTETGEGEYVNAGHDSPIICYANGACGFLDTEPQPIAGAFDFAEYKSSRFQMEAGNTILMYTDGLNEAVNADGQEFGMNNLCDMVRNSEKDSPEEICIKIEKTINEFADITRHSDDRTMLAVRWEKETGEYYRKTMPVRKETITELVDTVNELLHIYECPENTIRNIDVVIDEIGANLVDYSEADTLIFEYECGHNHIRMNFTDNGIPFNPEHSRVYETRNVLTPGGLGIHFIRSLMDEVCYGNKDGHNIYTITKFW